MSTSRASSKRGCSPRTWWGAPRRWITPPVLAEALTTLAEYNDNLGNARVAQELAWRAAVVSEASGHDRSTFRALLVLAAAEGAALDDYESAQRHLQRAEALLERFGDRTSDRIRLAITRADVAKAEGVRELAAQSYETAHALMVDSGLDQDPYAVNVLNSLSAVYLRLDRIDDATRTTRQALELGRRVFGESHPNVAVALAMLARLRRAQGAPREAAELLAEARRVFSDSLGEDHPNVASVDNDLALSFAALGRFDEARAAYQSAIQITQSTRGPMALNLAGVEANLGDLLRHHGHLREAIAHHERALTIAERKLGPDHRDVATFIDNLAEDHRRAGDSERALELFERARTIFAAAEGQDVDLSYSLAGIGLIRLAEGNLPAARTMLDRAVALDETHDATPQQLARARFGLAQVRWRQGETGGARRLARSAARGLVRNGSESREALSEIQAWLRERTDPDPGSGAVGPQDGLAREPAAP